MLPSITTSTLPSISSCRPAGWLLALTIDLQNTLFEAFEALLEAKIEGGIASGTYDVGVETITATSLRIVERRTIYTHPGTGAETQVFTIARCDRNDPLALSDALDQGQARLPAARRAAWNRAAAGSGASGARARGAARAAATAEVVMMKPRG